MKKLAKCIMIQGTASNVGKSVLAAAICRILKNKGYSVAPFKAQNMSNNSFVTSEGGEIGRAQAVQAEACGIEASVDHNPILLKPCTDQKAQVIAMGKPVTRITSIGQSSYKKRFEPLVEASIEKLRKNYDVVVMEGAGSPAEMNLKARDIVNMRAAEIANASVILAGDIDWGGIFAQLVGTYNLLDPSERKRVKGFLINKFRGDKKILNPGLEWIEKQTKKRVMGVIPFISDMQIQEEDSITSGDSTAIYTGLRGNTKLDRMSGKERDLRNVKPNANQLLVDIAWLPRISNFTDFDPLMKQPDTLVRFLHEPDRHTIPDLLIIPGTKSTIADLKYLRKSGMVDYILRAADAGVTILGVCGGYQMLGKWIIDEHAAESKEKKYPGLGLFNFKTFYSRKKTTRQVRGKHLESGAMISGYEIHMGQTNVRPLRAKAMFRLEDGCLDGFVEGNICGTYIHGLFDSPKFCDFFLNKVRKKAGLQKKRMKPSSKDGIDVVANIVEKNMDIKFLESLVKHGN